MRISLKKTLTTTLMIGFFLTISWYSYGRAHALINGPDLSIESPAEGTAVFEELITIAGTAHNAARIYLNDRQIFTNEAGAFSEQLLLSKGYNMIEITATDRFGKQHTEIIPIVHK